MTSVIILYVDEQMFHVSEKMSRTEAIIMARGMAADGGHVEAVDNIGENNEELLWSSRSLRSGYSG